MDFRGTITFALGATAGWSAFAIGVGLAKEGANGWLAAGVAVAVWLLLSGLWLLPYLGRRHG